MTKSFLHERKMEKAEVFLATLMWSPALWETAIVTFIIVKIITHTKNLHFCKKNTFELC